MRQSRLKSLESLLSVSVSVLALATGITLLYRVNRVCKGRRNENKIRIPCRPLGRCVCSFVTADLCDTAIVSWQLLT